MSRCYGNMTHSRKPKKNKRKITSAQRKLQRMLKERIKKEKRNKDGE